MRLYLLIIIAFSNLIQLNAQTITIGSGTNVNGTTTSSPVNIWYRRTVSQMVYTAAELTAAGATTSTDINDIGFFVTQVPLYSIPDYEIKIKHTTRTDADNNFGNGGWTTVKSAHNYVPTAGDWDMFNLDVPFTWNGTDNIVIKICWSAVNPTYNATGQCRVFNSVNGYKYRWTDDDGNSCANGNNPNSILNTKPQIKIVLDTISVWNGSVNTDWFNANNWSAGVPNDKMDAQIPVSVPNYPNLIGNGICEEFILDGSFNISASGSLEVKSHFTNSGTYNDAGGILIMNSNGSPNFNLNSDINLNELEINNTGQLTTTGTGNCNVQTELRINNGVFQTNNNVVLKSTASGTARIDELHAPCQYTLDMDDSWGDGWNGGFLTVLVNSVSIGTFSAAGTGTVSNFSVASGDEIELNYTSGSWENENSYSLLDSDGSVIFSDGTNPTTGNVFAATSNCEFNTLPIQGDVTMERYIGAGETYWRFFSSAVQGASIADYQDDFITAGYVGSPFPNFGWVSIYNYDETLGTGLGYIPVSSSAQILQPGEGFMVWSGDTITGTDPFTVDLKGIANQGNLTMPITYTNTSNPNEDGWNLVGNPYASTINWDSPNWDKNNMANAIQILNPQTQQYPTYVNGAATLGGSPLIASQQAFWVYANGAGASLVAKEGIKSSTDQAFFRASDVSPGMKITVSGQGVTDECIIRHIEGANDAFDSEFDAYKLYGGSSLYPNISLLNAEENEFTVHSFDKAYQEWEIPLKVLVPQSGNFDLTFNGVSGLDVPCLLIEDLYTNQIYSISDETILNFEMYDTTILPRFLLHMGRNYESNVLGTTCVDNNDGKIELDLESVLLMNYTLLFNDETTNFNGVVNPIQINDLSAGTYQLEVADLENTCNQSNFIFVIPSAAPILVNAEVDFNSVSISVNGGEAPYQIQWSNGITTAENNDLDPGIYFVEITDANGCVFQTNYSVEGDLGLNTDDTDGLSVYFVLESNEIVINNLNLNKDVEVKIVTVGGALVENYIVTKHSKSFNHKLKNKLAKGVYMVWVNDEVIKFVN